MHPLLFRLGPVPIHTYGFLIAVGFLVAVFVIRRLAIRDGLDAEKVLDLTFWSLLVGFAGARLLFVITRAEFFVSDPLAILKVWEGGLVFLGGPIAVFPFVLWYVRKHRIPVWKAMDVMIPGLVVAHMFGRFGCLMAGCCFGKPTECRLGIRFESELVDKAFRGIPLHPTQLYEATALLVLFIGLYWLGKRKKFDGQVVLTYFMAYPVIRSVIEVFRGDEIRGFVVDGIISTSQFISALVFAAALAVFIRLHGKGGRS
ncbi:MAG: prolipoprotein diacylglyceryl transferase [Bdellovibrionales bacterium RIFOXYD1_FULL_53_11]|nr:MAG: prolipoprotein diacylglyceryl transferase [Bdellovibrionales bacterium RIFOXYD1_FULL_53_11]